MGIRNGNNTRQAKTVALHWVRSFGIGIRPSAYDNEEPRWGYEHQILVMGRCDFHDAKVRVHTSLKIKCYITRQPL
jgi:hypothetical protein